MIDSVTKESCFVCKAPLNVYHSAGMKFTEPCTQCMANALTLHKTDHIDNGARIQGLPGRPERPGAGEHNINDIQWTK